MKKTFICFFIIILPFFFLMELNASTKGLKKLKPSIGDLSPTFSSEIYNYNIFLNENVKTIKFDAVCNNHYMIDKESKYVLNEGYNDIIISCKNKNEEIKYFINVVRGEIPKKTGLKSLNVIGYDIEFNPDKKEYMIDLKKETDVLLFDFKTYNDKDKVIVKGNGNFNSGTNMVKIVVSNDEEETVYKIKVIKSESVFKENANITNNKLESHEQIIYIVLLIFISLGLLYLTFHLLFIKKLF